MSWKSTEHVHRERRDFERMTHCKQDGRHVPSSACGTSAMSPCAVGGKLAMVSVCSLIGATEHSVACHRPQWIHARCPLNINNRESIACSFPSHSRLPLFKYNPETTDSDRLSGWKTAAYLKLLTKQAKPSHLPSDLIKLCDEIHR